MPEFASITQRLALLGSAKWDIHVKSRERIARGESIIELTIGEPDIPPDNRLVECAYQAMLAGRTRYSSGAGESNLRQALALKYTQRTGRAILPTQFLCLPGGQTCLYVAMMCLCQPGNDVLVPEPYYATYEGLVQASGANFIPVPLDQSNGFALDVASFERAITPQTRALLLNSPHNPTGAVFSRAALAKLVRLAHARDFWIISDEVYETLIFDGEFASPFDLETSQTHVLALSSISKSHAAPGFRSGWLVGPEPVIQAMLPVAETMLFGNQPFIADATCLAIAEENKTCEIMRRDYRRRAQLLADELSVCPSLLPIMPKAGMFTLLDVARTGLGGNKFAERLLAEKGVSVMPGASFGNSIAHCVRLGLTVPDEQIVRAARRMAEFATESMS